jgi:hypothetical protein
MVQTNKTNKAPCLPLSSVSHENRQKNESSTEIPLSTGQFTGTGFCII